MKNLILLAAFVTLLWGNKQKNKEPVSLLVTPNVVEISELPETVEVTMTNNTQKTISAGLYYWIEHYEGKEWKKVSPEQSFDDMAYTFSPSVFYRYDKHLLTDEIDYKIGKYRIAKYYLISDTQNTKERVNVYAEFEVR